VSDSANRRSARTRLLACLATALALAGVGLGASVHASAGGPSIIPYEPPAIVRGPPVYRGHTRFGISFKRLQLQAVPGFPSGVLVRIHCLGCLKSQSSSKRFVTAKQMRRQIVPLHATLIVQLTKPGWIGIQIRLRKAGTEFPPETVLCLYPTSKTAKPCPAPLLPPTVTITPNTVTPTSPPPPPPPPPPPNREAITSVDGTHGDRAPYSGEFTLAYQPFTAVANRITYLGATVANPNVAVGRDAGDLLTLRLCETADCSGGVLASGNEAVNNYGMTTVAVEATVVPGHTYYVVWAPPANAHGSHWLAFWHAGAPTIVGSREMEAIVRGFQEPESGPVPGPRSSIDYAGGQPPPAPYSGAFLYGSQSFKAASDTITKLGVIVGNPALARGAVGPETITLRLCRSFDCASGVLASVSTYIDNYTLTEVDIGDVVVTPGETYFLYWQSPRKIEGQSWVSFWQGQGPTIEQSRLLQAFARGYDRAGGGGPGFYPEQAGYLGAPTFQNPGSASGEGTRIPALGRVEVTCKIYAPQIESAEPDGYWYLVHSPPWSDQYYAVANTFWNGVTPGESGEPVNTDLSVPSCP
jgi:hypothetical protein